MSPQMSLSDEEDAWSMSIIMRANPLRPELGTTVNVMTYNRRNRVLGDESAQFVGTACDMLSDVAEAVTLAYLFGNRLNDPQRVLKRMASEAKRYAASADVVPA